MKNWWGFLLLLCFWATPVMAADFGVAVWLPYWHKDSGAANLSKNLKRVSEISPFSFEVRPDGTLIDRMKISASPWSKLFTKARAQKIEILPSILWTDAVAMQTILSTPEKRRAHIKEIIKTVERGRFDGIDIDYESKYARTMPHFSSFLTELGRDLKTRGKILSCTIESRTPLESLYREVPKTIEYANDLVVIGRVCDRVRIMTYDQMTIDIKLTNIKSDLGYYSPVADIDWVKKVIPYMAQSIPKNKIFVGVATYGYEYEVTDNRTFYSYKKIRALTYEDAMKLAKEMKVKPKRNSAGEISFTYKKDGADRLVWVSDADAVRQKYSWAKAYGLGGVAMFRVDGKSDPKTWSVFTSSGTVK